MLSYCKLFLVQKTGIYYANGVIHPHLPTWHVVASEIPLINGG
jgi:hypothetical protein